MGAGYWTLMSQWEQMQMQIQRQSQSGPDYQGVVQLRWSTLSLNVGETGGERSMTIPGVPEDSRGPEEAGGHGTSHCRLRLDSTYLTNDMEGALGEDRGQEA